MDDAGPSPGRAGAGTRRTVAPRRPRRSPRPRARSPSSAAQEAAVRLVLASARSPIRASPTGAAGRARGGSRPGSTRTPRRRRARAAPRRAQPSRKRGQRATTSAIASRRTSIGCAERGLERVRARRRVRVEHGLGAHRRAGAKRLSSGRDRMAVARARTRSGSKRRPVSSSREPPDVLDPTADPETPASTEPSRKGEPAKPPTRVVLVRHAVTAADRGRCSRGACRGSICRSKGVEQARPRRRGSRAPDRRGVREPDRAHHADRAMHRRHHRARSQALPGVIEADYGDWTGRQARRPREDREWKIVQVTPSRARFPEWRVAAEMQTRTVSRARGSRRAPSG